MALFVLFLITAALYSAVGFGGGSSYTALLALSGESPLTIRATALACNALVVSIGLFNHLKYRTISLGDVFPFLLFSVPVVAWTAQWRLEQRPFFLLLASALILAGGILLASLLPASSRASWEPRPLSGPARWMSRALLGTSLGALAGLTGIGGGIYLSPLLLLLRYDRPKRVAALASAFIFVNSLVGLLALFLTRDLATLDRDPLPLLLAVGTGGMIGARLMHLALREEMIRALTGVLVLFVGIRLLVSFF